MKFEGKAVAK